MMAKCKMPCSFHSKFKGILLVEEKKKNPLPAKLVFRIATRGHAKQALLYSDYRVTGAASTTADLATEKDMTALIAVARRAGLARSVLPSGGSSNTGSLSRALLASPTSSLRGASTSFRDHCCRSISASPHRQQGSGGSMFSVLGSRLPFAGEELASSSAGRRSAAGSSTSRSCSSSSGPTKPLLKPMRSVLYTPGSSRHLYKIRDIACDASLIDLEVRQSSGHPP